MGKLDEKENCCLFPFSISWRTENSKVLFLTPCERHFYEVTRKKSWRTCIKTNTRQAARVRFFFSHCRLNPSLIFSLIMKCLFLKKKYWRTVLLFIKKTKSISGFSCEKNTRQFSLSKFVFYFIFQKNLFYIYCFKTIWWISILLN